MSVLAHEQGVAVWQHGDDGGGAGMVDVVVSCQMTVGQLDVVLADANHGALVCVALTQDFGGDGHGPWLASLRLGNKIAAFAAAPLLMVWPVKNAELQQEAGRR